MIWSLCLFYWFLFLIFYYQVLLHVQHYVWLLKHVKFLLIGNGQHYSQGWYINCGFKDIYRGCELVLYLYKIKRKYNGVHLTWFIHTGLMNLLHISYLVSASSFSFFSFIQSRLSSASLWDDKNRDLSWLTDWLLDVLCRIDSILTIQLRLL